MLQLLHKALNALKITFSTRKKVKPVSGDVIVFAPIGGTGAEHPGQARRLVLAGSWSALAQEILDELPKGCTRVQLHNPFGLYTKSGEDTRLMWIDQWVLAQDALPDKLSDPEEFAAAIKLLKANGVMEVIAYVGSPLTLPASFRNIDTIDKLLYPLLSSGCSIGFDATYDWQLGDETDQIIQALRKRGHKVYIEPWQLADRKYGEVDGVIHLDRFFPRTRIGAHLLAESHTGERIIIQRNYSAKELIGLRELGASIAVRLHTATGQEVANLT